MRLFVLVVMLLIPVGSSLAHELVVHRQWADLFAERGVEGTIAVFDTADGRWRASDAQRATQRFLPASTFKIPHTLFALDAGVVDTGDRVFPWDGTPQPFPVWQKDQTLADAFRNSVPWVYQSLALAIGKQRELRYLRALGYGNQTVGPDLATFWLTGDLAISAIEQIDMLRRLEDDGLPFVVAHQQWVKALMCAETRTNRILCAKSGWAFDASPQVGWWVGWVELGPRRVFFALNMEITDPKAHPPLRAEIVEAVLRRLDAS